MSKCFCKTNVQQCPQAGGDHFSSFKFQFSLIFFYKCVNTSFYSWRLTIINWRQIIQGILKFKKKRKKNGTFKNTLQSSQHHYPGTFMSFNVQEKSFRLFHSLVICCYLIFAPLNMSVIFFCLYHKLLGLSRLNLLSVGEQGICKFILTTPKKTKCLVRMILMIWGVKWQWRSCHFNLYMFHD